jgi:hypothetical protein
MVTTHNSTGSHFACTDGGIRLQPHGASLAADFSVPVGDLVPGHGYVIRVGTLDGRSRATEGILHAGVSFPAPLPLHMTAGHLPIPVATADISLVIMDAWYGSVSNRVSSVSVNKQPLSDLSDLSAPVGDGAENATEKRASTKAPSKTPLYDMTEKHMGARISVRHILQRMVKEQDPYGHTLSVGLQRYEDLFGDPCPGMPKVLYVRYWLRGVVHATTQANNANFSVGLLGFAVQRAWFGRTDRSDGRDVTPWVQDLVKVSPNLTTSLEINGKYDTLFKSGSKRPGGRVSLQLLYISGGQEMLSEFTEDAAICLQHGSSAIEQQNTAKAPLSNIFTAVRTNNVTNDLMLPS